MLGQHFPLSKYLNIVSHLLSQLSTNEAEQLADTLCFTWTEGGHVILCGEGTSALAAMLISEHLTACSQRMVEFGSRNVISLAHSSNSNHCFARCLDKGNGVSENLQHAAKSGDLLIAMSVSGDDPELIKAVEWGNDSGLTTWGLTGHGGGTLRKQARHHLRIPLKDPGLVETILQLLLHWVMDDVSARMREQGRYSQHEVAPLPH